MKYMYIILHGGASEGGLTAALALTNRQPPEGKA